MNINKNNYEAWFLDYHEGNLSESRQSELFRFLENHPDLKEEFNAFENIPLPVDEILFEEKESLKKHSVTLENYPRYFIAFIEGDLSVDEKIILENFLSVHPELKKELDLFSKTKLTVDTSIVYPGKSSLKKPIPIFGIQRQWYYVAAAACILLMIGVYFFNNSGDNVVPIQANEKNRKESPVVADKNNKNTQQEVEEKNNFVVKNNLTEKTNPATNKNLAEKTELKNVPSNRKRKAIPINIQEQKSNVIQTEFELAQTLPVKQIGSPDDEPQPVVAERKNNSPENKTASQFKLTGHNDDALTVLQYIRKTSEQKITQLTESPKLSREIFDEKTPAQQKSLGLFAWIVKKLSGKKAELKSDFDPDGQLTAYEFTAGKFQVSKSYGDK